MGPLRNLDVRWVWRYRLFYIAGIAIMSLQVFLAVIFFTLSEDVEKNSSLSHISLKEEPMKLNIIDKTLEKEHKLPFWGEHSNTLSRTNDQFSRQSAKTVASVEELVTPQISTVCNISRRESISAINRAKSSFCKQLILNTTCLMRNNQLYPVSLPHSCPVNGLTRGKYLGCFRDESSKRLLNGAYYNSSIANSQSHCLQRCLLAGFSYAGVQFGEECFCGNEDPSTGSLLPESSCDYKCPANKSQSCGSYFAMNILETGVAKFVPQRANDANSISSPPVRIVFLLTLNGRDIRQVYRLIKALFHRDHFFFIHVDARQDYLFRELRPLELKLSNVRLSLRRHSTIWGGASLLTMLLECMSELIQSSWDWDFVINLSESDFPIKTNQELVAFLSSNRNRNFVKSHGRDVHHFIHKQGLDKTFVECDEHMWRIGNKMLPSGIVIDGGSDWIALSRPFINYIVTAQNDELLDGLKTVFKYTLLPAESFFHTVLRNSIFCDTYIDNNLHVTNWKRHLGCKCQYKHVVDWCGCSPNVFTMEDWSRIQLTSNKSLFFARKFDPTVSQLVINQVQEWLYGYYSDDYKSERKYWHNVYHHLDRSPVVDEAIYVVSSSLSRQTLISLENFDLKCLNLEFRKLLQVHSFYENDFQKGILVHFDSVTSKNVSVQFEAWFVIKYSYTIYESNPVALRFINLLVNTNFDPKEKMSRNYVGAIGPLSEPVLIFEVIAGSPVSNITVLWLDPMQTLVDVGDISLGENSGVDHVKSNLKTPLCPGEWEVYLIFNNDVLARVMFAVTPPMNEHSNTMYHEANQIKTSTDWSLLLPIVKLNKERYDPESQRTKILNHLSYLGSKKIEWIDDLTSKSFQIVNFCIVDIQQVENSASCYHQDYIHCNSTLWSSFSPDPKIHITTVNKLTGRLNW